MDMKLHDSNLGSPEAPAALAAIREVADGFKVFQVLRTGFRSGLFDWLQKNGPADRKTIGAALDLRGAHLGGYLQALEDMGLVSREDNSYQLAPGMEAVLCSSSPWCQADVIEDMLAASNGWASLDRFMSADWAASPPTALSGPQHPFAGEADRLADHLATRYKDASIRNILCFDSGDGLFAKAAHARFPDAQIIVVVPPEALSRAQEVLAAAGDQITVLPGSPLDPPAVEPVDLAVLFHALYPVRRTTNDALAAVAQHLAPGGELHCAHWFCLEACETAPGGLRDLDKAILTDSHPMCHVETFCDRFEKFGLIDADRTDLIGEYGTTKLHFARRPQHTEA